MISDLLNSIWFEVFAALLAITYLVLAMQQDIRCWIAWIISSVMYFFVMLTAGLIMEAVLQIFYLIMGLYGWSQWKRKASSQSSNIKTWTLRQHFSALSLLFVSVVCFGYLLTANTNAVSPYIDSFTTWGAILATYMVAKKVLENWIYWFVVDFVSVFLFLSRELYPTVVLFVIYLIIIVFGYKAWLKSMNTHE